MNKTWIGVVSTYLILTAESAFCGSLDPSWMFSDTSDFLYSNFQYCDTNRQKNLGCVSLSSDKSLPDTGIVWDRKYINLDYKLVNDTLKFINKHDSSVIDYQDYRQCVAGFKTAWEGGMVGFTLPRYKYLVFAHKGPNSKHKVTVRTWFNDGTCGAESFNEYVGTFNASESWKLDSIEIPEAIRNKTDKERNTSQYYEFVFIITNIDENDKTESGPCNFKMDDIRLSGYNPIDTSPKPAAIKAGETATLKVYANPAEKGDGLTYQWKKDGNAINGATSETYNAKEAGKYTVDAKVASSGYTFTSYPAEVTVEGKVEEPAKEEEKGGMCGGGALLAFLPPIFFKAFSSRKKKQK